MSIILYDFLQLKAHKMVLSACSPYFQSMLYNTPDRHPIVFLRDVRYHEMKALLEFMYRGEVSVDQENLSSLLKVAEGLKIKGLAEVSDGAPPPTASSASSSSSVSSGQQQQQQQRLSLMMSHAHLLSSPHHQLDSSSPIKRMASPPSGVSSGYVGPKRKRAKPRRLSGSEAVPLASGLAEAVEVARSEQKAQEQAEAAVAAAVAAAAIAATVEDKKEDISESERARGREAEENNMDAKLDRVSNKPYNNIGLCTCKLSLRTYMFRISSLTRGSFLSIGGQNRSPSVLRRLLGQPSCTDSRS